MQKLNFNHLFFLTKICCSFCWIFNAQPWVSHIAMGIRVSHGVMVAKNGISRSAILRINMMMAVRFYCLILWLKFSFFILLLKIAYWFSTNTANNFLFQYKNNFPWCNMKSIKIISIQYAESHIERIKACNKKSSSSAVEWLGWAWL